MAISAALIWAKSRDFSVSRSETVSRALSSVNSTGGSSSRGGGVKASATRKAPASGFRGSLSTRGVTGDICAISFSISPRRRQNSRKAWS